MVLNYDWSQENCRWDWKEKVKQRPYLSWEGWCWPCASAAIIEWSAVNLWLTSLHAAAAGPHSFRFSNSQIRCLLPPQLLLPDTALLELETWRLMQDPDNPPCMVQLVLLSPSTSTFSSWCSVALTSGPAKATDLQKHFNQFPLWHKVQAL